MKRRTRHHLLMVALICGASLHLPSPTAAEETDCDPDRGRETFALCESCHATTPDGSTPAGPTLHGVIGRKAGTLTGYAFSDVLRESDITWDRTSLDRFLEKPNRFLPGTTMMFFGLRDPQKRADLICYLESTASDSQD